MGNKSFRLSPLAEQDLENIWLYTYQEWSNEQADIREGYWKYFVASHVLYFVKNKSANGIDVIRILHKSMDTGSQL